MYYCVVSSSYFYTNTTINRREQLVFLKLTGPAEHEKKVGKFVSLR